MTKPKKATLLKMPRRRTPPVHPVESRILFLRHQRVILDADIAELYGVPVRVLNQQLKRNRNRFPSDFVFQLTAKEHKILRSQIVISSSAHGGRRYRPYAFTEHGALMAATILNSERAVQMSVFVVRASYASVKCSPPTVTLRQKSTNSRVVSIPVTWPFEISSKLLKNWLRLPIRSALASAFRCPRKNFVDRVGDRASPLRCSSYLTGFTDSFFLRLHAIHYVRCRRCAKPSST